jgi:dsDNA-specific endonuclease/ATPase MutS2
MRVTFEPGDAVQTAFGMGVVREVRNRGRLLVDVAGRALVLKEEEVSRASPVRRRSPPAPVRHSAPPKTSPRAPAARRAAVEVDLHGLTVEEALARAESTLNDALLADVTQVRFIHGRSGGRIRAALHRRLGAIPSVRHYLLDPRNEGVTIVEL